MSFKLEQGLFTLEFTDYHAILGIPVDAEIKDIRKRYLGIARRLHPDSFTTEDEADRQRANEYLSKLVNPAYEQLAQEKNHTEHQLLLKLKGQQALRQQETVVLTNESARRLATVSELEQSYRALVRELAEKQYETLSETLNCINQVSELNLVYLMRKEGKLESGTGQRKAASSAATGRSAAPRPTQPAAPAPPPTKESITASNLRRALEFESKQDYGKAIMELREALKINPAHSQCHTRLGVIYMKLNQGTMAKIHFNQALKLNPQDATATEGIRRLDSAVGEVKGAKVQKPKDGKSDKSGGGFLGGLFGGKK